MFQTRFGSFFGSFFAFFKPFFVSIYKFFGGSFVLQTCRPNKLGTVPTTPDPNSFAKVSRYKWEPYRDTNWWCRYCFLPRGGHALAEVSRYKWEVYRDTLQKHRGQGSILLS